MLREAGAQQQFAVLADRAAAHAALDNPREVGYLLDALQEAGAQQQAAVMIGRLPAEGLFQDFFGDLFADRYQFGREPDGSPAPPWGWHDLDPSG